MSIRARPSGARALLLVAPAPRNHGHGQREITVTFEAVMLAELRSPRARADRGDARLAASEITESYAWLDRRAYLKPSRLATDCFTGVTVMAAAVAITEALWLRHLRKSPQLSKAHSSVVGQQYRSAASTIRRTAALLVGAADTARRRICRNGLRSLLPAGRSFGDPRRPTCAGLLRSGLPYRIRRNANSLFTS